MAQKPETVFRRKVVLLLKKCFPTIYITSIQQLAIVGTPDLLICLNGKYVALEIKSKEGKPSLLQSYNLDLIKKAGGLGYVVYPSNLDSVVEELKSAVA